MNNITPFAISGLFLGVTCTILLIFLCIYGKSKIHRIWTFFNVSVAIWGYLAFLIGIGQSEDQALLLWRSAFIGVIFIPVFFYHLVLLFCGIQQRIVLKIAYIQGLFFLLLNLFSDLYISKVVYLWNSVYYLKSSGLLFSISFLIWLLLVVIGHIELIRYFNKLEEIKQNQALYMLVGFLIGFLGGTTNFFPMFGFLLYPYGNFTVSLYCIITTYAILRHRLLDVRVAFTRTGIFIAVYSFVLGIPFAVAFGFRENLYELFGENWWIAPLTLSTVLATLGPFIYVYIQNRAEEQLLKEQRRYQATLSQASSGMGRIKDLKRLLELIVYIVTRAVRLEHSSVFIFDNAKNKYLMGAYKRSVDVRSETEVASDSPLVKYLIKIKLPIVYEEIKQRVQDYNDEELAKVEEALTQLDAALVVPSLIEDRLLAILILGKKKSGKLFGEDDLSVFSILANQAALAIENAQFYEDVKNTQEQLFQAEKMATIGTMADGLSHQINNRLHALGFIAGDALDTIKMKRNAEMSKEMREVISDLERSLVRIQENVKQGGEVVQGLLRYTRKGEQGHAAVEIDKVVTAALEMAQFKIKTHEMKILREYNKEGPRIKGNFTQLQEVFFNMIDNAYDAMMQRKNEKKEEGFQPTLRIQSVIEQNRMIIKFLDNGIGVRPEDVQKIFTPFFTTKLSSRKGTGLGLYVIKKIVEENHKGKVSFESNYMQGTTMILNLPVSY